MRLALVTAVLLVQAVGCTVSETPSAMPSTSKAVPDTAYAPPAGAKYVSIGGDDANPGTQGAPWRTLGHAVGATADRGTIVIRGGTYHEGGVKTYKNLTIQAYPHEQVWFDGAEKITGFVYEGNGHWRKDGWAHLFTDGSGRPVGTTIDARKLDDDHPLAGWPDMIWVDGAYKTQVGSLAALSHGEFYVDYARRRLYLGDDPTGKLVEAATLTSGLNLEGGTGGAVRGIGFKRYATHDVQPYIAALRVNKPGVTIENCAISGNAGEGLAIYGDDVVVRGCKLINNGKNGVAAYKADRLLVENNRISWNNRERFEIFWDSSGIKIVGAQDTIVRDNIFENNYTSGYWCDISCIDGVLVRNKFVANRGPAIKYEISAGGIIASNVIVDTESFGIYLFEPNNVLVWNNTLARNQVGIVLAEQDRTSSAADRARGVTWQTQNITVKNNVLANKSGSSWAWFIDWDGGTPATTFLDALDYNVYLQTSPAAKSIEFQSTSSRRTTFQSLAAFRTAYPAYEAHGSQGAAAGSPYLAGLGSTAAGVQQAAALPGAPLPAKVAAAINGGLARPLVKAGAPVQRGALTF